MIPDTTDGLSLRAGTCSRSRQQWFATLWRRLNDHWNYGGISLKTLVIQLAETVWGSYCGRSPGWKEFNAAAIVTWVILHRNHREKAFITGYWGSVEVPVSVFHKAGAEFVKAAPSVFKAWCRRAELRRLLAGGEVPCLAHCPRSGACNWPACSPALPAQLHPGCYLLSALWWPLSSVRAALISLTRRPRVWRCRLVRGTKASTARSATSATGVTQRSSCALKHGSCHPWLCVVRTWLIVDLEHLGRSALHSLL